MDREIADSESIARFLKPKQHYSPSKGQIKYKAFFPPFANPEISVYRIDGLVDEDVWGIADEFVAPYMKDFDGRLEARADTQVAAVRESGLDVEPDTRQFPDGKPAHPRHSNIVDWPNPPKDPSSQDQRNEVREKWQELANRLTLEASFVSRS